MKTELKRKGQKVSVRHERQTDLPAYATYSHCNDRKIENKREKEKIDCIVVFKNMHPNFVYI